MASNLPPGVTQSMIDAHFGERPCDVCGYDADDCVCPECPECGTQGDPNCYIDRMGLLHQPLVHHGMTLSTKQKIGRGKRRIKDLEEQIAEEGMNIQYLECQLIDEENHNDH